MSAFKSYIPSAVRFEVSNYKIRHGLDVAWLRNASAIAKAMPHALQCQNTNHVAKDIAERISVRNTKENAEERKRLEEGKQGKRGSRYISNFYFVYDSSGKRHIKFGVEPAGHSNMPYYELNKKEGIAAKAEQLEEEKQTQEPEKYDVAAKIGDKICKRLNTNRATGETEVRGKKYMDAKFWRRKLNGIVNPLREEYLYRLGMIQEDASLYSSKSGQNTRKSGLLSQKRWAAAHKVVSPDGEYEKNLLELIEANKKGYAAKITAKAAGLNKYAKAHKLTAAMITVTCPGTFRKDGTTLQEALDHLRVVWKRVNAERLKQCLKVAGLMVWQPHQKPIAHQHIYVIGSQNDISTLYSIIYDKAREVYPDEKGAKERRTNIKWQDNEIGSLSSYALSYVIRYAKDDDGTEAKGEACEMDGSAEDTWYAMNRCRRIGWFGLPEDTHWSHSARAKRWQVKNKKTIKMREAARKGDYFTWLELAGGIGTRRKDRAMSAIRVERETAYGETTYRYIGSTINGNRIIVKGVIPLEIIEYLSSAVVIPNYPSMGKGESKDSVLPVSQPAAP